MNKWYIVQQSPVCFSITSQGKSVVQSRQHITSNHCCDFTTPWAVGKVSQGLQAGQLYCLTVKYRVGRRGLWTGRGLEDENLVVSVV